MMLESTKIDLGVKLAVDTLQQIEIERRGDALLVVIGALQHLDILDQINADDQRSAATQHARRMTHKRRGLMRFEIADGRAREEAYTRQFVCGARQIERLTEVGG